MHLSCNPVILVTLLNRSNHLNGDVSISETVSIQKGLLDLSSVFFKLTYMVHHSVFELSTNSLLQNV